MHLIYFFKDFSFLFGFAVVDKNKINVFNIKSCIGSINVSFLLKNINHSLSCIKNLRMRGQQRLFFYKFGECAQFGLYRIRTSYSTFTLILFALCAQRKPSHHNDWSHRICIKEVSGDQTQINYKMKYNEKHCWNKIPTKHLCVENFPFSTFHFLFVFIFYLAEWIHITSKQYNKTGQFVHLCKPPQRWLFVLTAFSLEFIS